MISNLAWADFTGRRVADVLDELRATGLTFIYSSQRVPSELLVLREPASRAGINLAREILAQHELGLMPVAPGVYSVIAQARSTAVFVREESYRAAQSSVVEEIVVETSRYTLSPESVVSETFLTQEQVNNMPRLADETLRALQRLPGMTTNGFSSIGSVRGGEPNETAIVLDGLRLYEPFHLKNFLSPVSLLDARVIDGIEFYSGGFPAVYGDRMSAIVDASTVRPTERYFELGLNLFHASALAASPFEDGRGHALLSARRSNVGDLARFSENDFGEPHYSDAFARADYEINETTDVALNLLMSQDSIRAVQSSGRQRANAEYRNVYAWGTLDHQWSEHFDSRLIASYTDLVNKRRGEVNDPGARFGTVRDNRSFHIFGLRSENDVRIGEVAHRFGVELRRLWGKYDYESEVITEQHFPFPGSSPGIRTYSAAPKPDGFEAGAFWDAKATLNERWTVQGGMRIDTQTYDGSDDGEQWSPRLSVLYTLNPRTGLRASWGRFFQSQGINELQVEDGIGQFHPAQYADHAIVSFEHEIGARFDLRIEGFDKEYRRLSPRFENMFDPLALFPEAEFDRVMIDADSSRARGVELMLRMRPYGPWSGWFGYSWSRAEDHIGGRTVPRSWDQRNAISFGAVWARGPWTATVANSYHSGWPTTSLQIDYQDGMPQLDTEARNRGRFASFNSLDVRVTRTFALPRGALDVFAEINNLLDRQNPCCVEYEISRADDGTTVYSRNVDPWLPLVPSVGVLWRFGSLPQN